MGDAIMLVVAPTYSAAATGLSSGTKDGEEITNLLVLDRE